MKKLGFVTNMLVPGVLETIVVPGMSMLPSSKSSRKNCPNVSPLNGLSAKLLYGVGFKSVGAANAAEGNTITAVKAATIQFRKLISIKHL